jgi:hypothetical protein
MNVSRKRTARRTRVSLPAAAALAVAAGLLTVSTAPAADAQLARPAAAAALPAYGTLWITSPSTGAILEFAPPNNTVDQTPIADITGTKTGLNDPAGLALDHQARIWVANFGAAMVLVFGAHANGDVTPVMTISGAKTGLNEPIAVALTQKGAVWVANQGSSTLTEYAAGAHGNVAPLRTIAGSNAKLANLSGLAVSPDGTRVWVSEERPRKSPTPPTLVEFSGTAHGDVKPLTVISGLDTQLNDPAGVAVGVAGNDPTAVNENLDHPSAVLTFAPGAHGDAKPTRQLSGENTGLHQPQLPALDAVGNVWVPSTENNLVLRFGPTQHGNVGPQRLFDATELDNPGSIAVFIRPPTAPRSVHATMKKRLRITWGAPHVAGGGILGYEVRRAHKKGGPWTVVATRAASKRTYTRSKPHNGFFYDVIAFNEAGFSTPSHPKKPTT